MLALKFTPRYCRRHRLVDRNVFRQYFGGDLVLAIATCLS